MRKFSLIVLLAICGYTGFGASAPSAEITPPIMPKDVQVPLMGTRQLITLEEFLRLNPQTYRELTGKKMTVRQRIDLSVSKHVAKKMIRKDGSVDVERMKKIGLFGGWHWHWGGFLLGFCLSFIGPIVALFFNDEYKWDRFWSALHTALWLAVIGVAIVAAATGSTY